MKKFLKMKRTIRLLIIAILGIVAVVGWRAYSNMKANEEDPTSKYDFTKVVKRDITVTLSGAGTLKPANSYTVVSLVSGDIITAPFEEGEIIEKNAVLFEIDNSGVSSSLESAELSLADSQRLYRRTLDAMENLTIKADGAGRIIDWTVEEGDSVVVGQTLGTIRNDQTFRFKVPFLSVDANTLSTGDPITIYLDGTDETLPATIQEISPFDEVLQNGAKVKFITADVKNPGGLTTAYTGVAMANNLMSQAGGVFSYTYEGMVQAKVSGDVKTILHSVGETVARGDVLIQLESQSLMDELASAKNNIRRSEITLENQSDTIENYLIRSPISGTVIEKNYKQGDTLESGKVVSTIFDLSYLTMTLNIDELDISKVAVGQAVYVTADAVANREYSGVVTKININGITTGGTTSYPVTIRLNEITGLLPGMNVDAKIVIESRTAVLSIPTEAVYRGSSVLIKDASSVEPGADGTPTGFKYLTVATGVSDTDYIEILSGLAEGDEVAVEKRVFTNTIAFPRGQPGNPDTSYEEVDTP